MRTSGAANLAASFRMDKTVIYWRTDKQPVRVPQEETEKQIPIPG